MDINIAAIIIGLIFVAAGVLLLVKQLQSQKKNTSSVFAEVTGYITQIQNDSDHGDTTVYFPIMKYYAAGQWYEKQSDVGRGKEKYAVGERVEILYDPMHPEKFIIAGDRSTLIVSIIVMLMGIGVCVLSFFAD